MHFHTPFHPTQWHPSEHMAETMNLVLILLGLLVAIFLAPIHLD